MNTSIMIFAIQAGVRLGRKLNDVLVDETRERALILPLGNLYGNVVENDVFFIRHDSKPASRAEMNSGSLKNNEYHLISQLNLLHLLN